MKKSVFIGTMLGFAVTAALLMGCQPTPYYDSPEYQAQLLANRRTEIVQTGQTERTEVRETGRTERKEAEAERSLNMRLMQQEQNSHQETMFRLYALTIVASGYDNAAWIMVGAVIGALTCYWVNVRTPAKKGKGKGEAKKQAASVAKQIVREIRKALETDCDYTVI